MVLSLAVAVTSACGGVGDVKTRHSDGTAGAAGAAGGAVSMAGTPDPAGAAGAQTDSMAGSGAGGADTDGVCAAGERGCNGDTPQVCQAGVWIAEAPCDATTQACTGAGICAAFRLTDSGIGTFGARPAEPIAGAKLILKLQTLTAAPRVCNSELCITGDLR